jgi:hypothetical protein
MAMESRRDGIAKPTTGVVGEQTGVEIESRQGRHVDAKALAARLRRYSFNS